MAGTDQRQLTAEAPESDTSQALNSGIFYAVISRIHLRYCREWNAWLSGSGIEHCLSIPAYDVIGQPSFSYCVGCEKLNRGEIAGRTSPGKSLYTDLVSSSAVLESLIIIGTGSGWESPNALSVGSEFRCRQRWGSHIRHTSWGEVIEMLLEGSRSFLLQSTQVSDRA